jgi:hypothetical protein
MTKPRVILPRDRIIALRLENRSWDEIGRELGISAATAKTTYRMAELILAEGIVGILATPMLGEPREADCLPLRDVLEDLAEQNPQSVLYTGLLRLLDRTALRFDWFDLDDRPIRLWSSNGGIALMAVLEELHRPVCPCSRATKGLSEFEKLEQLIMGNFVFTTDMFDGVLFGGRVNELE